MLAPIAEEGEVDEERAGEVAHDDAEWPAVEHDDEQDSAGNRQDDVREARDHERDRPLLDPEER